MEENEEITNLNKELNYLQITEHSDEQDETHIIPPTKIHDENDEVLENYFEMNKPKKEDSYNSNPLDLDKANSEIGLSNYDSSEEDKSSSKSTEIK